MPFETHKQAQAAEVSCLSVLQTERRGGRIGLNSIELRQTTQARGGRHVPTQEAGSEACSVDYQADG